jgi:hypothetical protein
MTKHESSAITLSSSDAVKARNEMFNMLGNYPATPEETERSLGLFLRGSLLARILGVQEIYKQIVDLPGIIVDVGTWRGQTAVLCENFRAIYEPLNFNRRILCLDTFEGYKGFGDKDNPTTLHQDGTYGVGGEQYVAFLKRLLELHERSNAMGHNCGKHTVIAGDCCETLPRFFEEHANEVVALAFFDLNCYEPTKDAFERIFRRLVPGGIIAFWQLTRGSAVQAEGRYYADEVIGKLDHTLKRAATYPGLCYLKK